MIEKGRPKQPIDEKRPYFSPRFIPLAVLLLVAVLLSLLLPDFFRQVILAPVLSRLVVLYGIYRGFPQNIVWGFFVFVAVVLALYALRPQLDPNEAPFKEDIGESRLKQLASMTANARTGQHARWELAREIQQLTLGLMQLETAETPETLRQRIQQGSLPAPPELLDLLDLCAMLPNYRTFLELREASPTQRIQRLDTFDPEATVNVLLRWRQSNQELP
jgi:cell division protein FtsW (lipid II flippase)